MKTAVDYHLSHNHIGPFRLVQLQIVVPELPRVFAGYRIAALGDLHYGCLTPSRFIQSAIYITRQLEPQSILLLGDYLQVTRSGYRYALAQQLSQKIAGWTDYRRLARKLSKQLGEMLAVLSPPDGIYAILGNHDHIDGPRTIIRYLGNDLRWMVNSSAEIRKENHAIKLYGIDDLSRGQANLKQTLNLTTEELPSVDPSVFFRLFLSHNPDITLTSSVPPETLGDLILCGHTHGGQIRLPGIGPIVTHTKQRKYVQGMKPWGQSTVLIHNGIGLSVLPLRLFAPPEIVLLEFQRA